MNIEEKVVERGVVDRVHEEHEDIRTTCSKLRDLARDPAGTEPEVFVGRLEQLVGQLTDHFELEETSGMFIDITAQRPELGRRVQRLLDQHHDLRRDFAAALAAARTATVGEVAVQVLDALDALADHERTETELLQEAYLTDVGVGD